MNTEGATPWAVVVRKPPHVGAFRAGDRAHKAKKRAARHAARWGAGTPLNQSLGAVAERKADRLAAHNERKRASAPVQTRTAYQVETSYRPLRPKLIDGKWIDRKSARPSKDAIGILLVRKITAHDVAKYGATGFMATTQAEAERMAIAERYREECLKALLARRAA